MLKKIIRYLMVFCNKFNKLRISKQRRKTKSHIAMFHDIKRDNEQRTSDYDCYISNLIQYVNCCRDMEIEFCTLDDLKQTNYLQKNMAVLTFDDGFESIYSLVYPNLKKLEVPFTIYITTEYLGQEGYLSVDQLKELSGDSICTIAMHAHEHKMFRYEASRVLEKDFVTCQKILTEILGYSPSHYAFPYGSVYAVSRRNRRIIKAHGVSSIALTNQLMLSPKAIKHPFKLPRLDIPGYYIGRIKEQYRGIEVGVK